ncbi:hypothetical protein OA84_07485 [Kaistella solincola]|uniref:Uncharacterized protein n=1 Tax=Kaistella solincola TaxID=510955 RepID=A0ABR4ZQN6_9FLAO|nr:hypothetical protein OA84_07485 [Kaistella solincola]
MIKKAGKNFSGFFLPALGADFLVSSKDKITGLPAPIAAASFCGTKCSKRYSGKRVEIFKEAKTVLLLKI